MCWLESVLDYNINDDDYEGMRITTGEQEIIFQDEFEEIEEGWDSDDNDSVPELLSADEDDLLTELFSDFLLEENNVITTEKREIQTDEELETNSEPQEIRKFNSQASYTEVWSDCDIGWESEEDGNENSEENLMDPIVLQEWLDSKNEELQKIRQANHYALLPQYDTRDTNFSNDPETAKLQKDAILAGIRFIVPHFLPKKATPGGGSDEEW